MSGGFRRGHTAAAKITAVDAAEIYRLWAEEGWSQARLARHYHLSETQVGRICRGTSWQQVPRGVHHGKTEQSQTMLDVAEPVPFEVSADFMAELAVMKQAAVAPEIPLSPELAVRAAGYLGKPAIQAQSTQECGEGSTDAPAPERGDGEAIEQFLSQVTEESAK